MTYVCPPHIIQRHSVKAVYFAPAFPPIARDAVLKSVIDLECDFQRYMLAAMRIINPNISDDELGDKGIFSEGKLLGSLSKCLRLAKVWGLTSTDELHDLDKLVKLRNMYAHDRDRKEISEDIEALDMVRTMIIYRKSQHLFGTMSAGKAFLCCVDSLAEVIKDKREGIESR